MQSTLLKTETAMAEEAPKQENSTLKTKRLTQQSRFWLKEAMAQHGGLITLADLRAYQVVERQPPFFLT